MHYFTYLAGYLFFPPRVSPFSWQEGLPCCNVSPCFCFFCKYKWEFTLFFLMSSDCSFAWGPPLRLTLNIPQEEPGYIVIEMGYTCDLKCVHHDDEIRICFSKCRLLDTSFLQSTDILTANILLIAGPCVCCCLSCQPPVWLTHVPHTNHWGCLQNHFVCYIVPHYITYSKIVKHAKWNLPHFRKHDSTAVDKKWLVNVWNLNLLTVK